MNYNFWLHVITVSQNQTVSTSKILTLDEAESLLPLPAELLTLDQNMKSEVFQQINQLFQGEDKIKVRQTQKPKPEYDNSRFPTLETCDNPELLTPIPRKLLNNFTILSNLNKKPLLN